MNRYTVKIDGADVTRYVPYPIAGENVLDAALDQGYIELRNTHRKKPYEPFSMVEITVNQYIGQTDMTGDNLTIFYVGADDPQTCTRTGLTNHKLLLTEETKILERIVCAGKSFVNPLYKDYATSEALNNDAPILLMVLYFQEVNFPDSKAVLIKK